MTSPTPLSVQSAQSVRAGILRTITNGLIGAGVANPQVVGTDFDLIATGVANEVAIASNNASLLADEGMPDTATASDLDRWLAIYGLTRRAASSSGGLVIATGTYPTFIVSGSQLTDPTAGTKFQVSLSGIYGNGSAIPVRSIDLGSQTNEPDGATLQWVSPPPGFGPTVVVSASNPLTGGVDAEDDDTARARLLAYLANPPGAGNPSQLAGFALAADPSVQAAFVSCAARGPSTVDLTVIGYATAVSSSRRIDPVVMANTIYPYVIGQLPQFVDGYVANCINYPIDVSVALSLPNPITAVPAGPGGGFLDPSPLSVTTAKPAIRVVDGYALSSHNPAIPQNTASSFWVDFPVPPVSGNIYNVSYLSPLTLTLSSAQTSGTYPTFSTYSVSGHTTLYLVSLNSPFYADAPTNEAIQPGNWIFPTAANTATYVSAFLGYMAGLGPGERTVIPGLLPRALRQVPESQAWPYRLNNRLLKPIEQSGNEVYSSAILFRGAGGTTDSGGFVDYGSLTTNADPAYSSYSPPTAYLYNGTANGDSLCFVTSNFGLYPQV